MARQRFWHRSGALIPLLGLLAGCPPPPPPPVDHTLDLLQQLADTVNLESAAWREQVDVAREELIRNGRQAIANDLDNVVQRGIAALGAEFRCDVDFLRNRVSDDIEGIMAALTGGTPPAAAPVLCKQVPEIIDLNQPPASLTRVSLFGYDLKRASDGASQLQLRALRANGGTVRLNDWLALSSHYQGVIAISQERGRYLRDQAIKELQIVSSDSTLAQIPVVPYAPILKSDTGVARQQTFFPPKDTSEGGDDEFWTGWKGDPIPWYGVVRVNLHTEAKVSGNKVLARVRMQALEWDRDADKRRGDGTAADGWSEWIELYSAPANYKLKRLVSDKDDNPGPFKCEKEPETLERAGSLVLRYKVVGDGDGNDIGKNTKVEVTYNAVKVELERVDPWGP